MRTFKIICAALIFIGICSCGAKKTNLATVGVYYFDGWSGKNRYADDPAQPWAKNAPSHLTKRFVEEFSEREPVWGWRNDSQEIMERQIDLAAELGNGYQTLDQIFQRSAIYDCRREASTGNLRFG